MTRPKLDPPRLLDLPETDALLHAALRGARERGPTGDQLHALAGQLERARTGASGRVAWRSAALKALAIVIGGLGVWAGLQLFTAVEAPLPAATPRAPDGLIHTPQTSAASTPESSPPSAAGTLERSPLQPAQSTQSAQAKLRRATPKPDAARKRAQAWEQPAAPTFAASAPEPSIAPEPSVTRTAALLPSKSPAPAQRAESELELLARAQGLLGRDPQAALQVIALHVQRFPAGSFRQEREALALDALQRLGRRQELQVRARAFMARYPNSPHAERISSWLR